MAYAASLLASQPLTNALEGVQEEEEVEEGQEREADQAPTLPDHLLAALLATMGEEVVEADLVGVPQWQLGAKVDDRQRRLLEEGVGEEEVEVRARLQSLTLPTPGTGCTPPPPGMS